MLYIFLFGVNVVFWDEWDIVPLFQKLHGGTLGFSDLFLPHNEHRILFPKLVFLLVDTISRYNTVVEMFCIFAFLCGTFIIFFLAFCRCKSSFVAFLPISFLLFNLKQLDNLLWGFQIGFAMTQFFSILSLYLLSAYLKHKQQCLLLLCSSACAFVASFSSLPGIFVWPAGFFMLLVVPPCRKTELFAWSATGMCVFALYFWGLNSPAMPSAKYMFSHLDKMGMFVLLEIGSSLHLKDQLLAAEGIFIIIIFGNALYTSFKKRVLSKNVFWIAVAAFSLISLLAIAAGRMTLNFESSADSRYVAFSALFVVATYGFLLSLYEEAKHKRVFLCLLYAFYVLFLAALPYDYSIGFMLGKESRDYKMLLSLALLHYEKEPDDVLRRLYPDSSIVKARAPLLKKYGYNVFSEPTKRYLIEFEKSYRFAR